MLYCSSAEPADKAAVHHQQSLMNLILLCIVWILAEVGQHQVAREWQLCESLWTPFYQVTARKHQAASLNKQARG